MSTKYKAKNEDHAYFITITVVDWIDLFTRLNHKSTIIDSLRYCQEHKGLQLYAYVLMSNHLHMLCRAEDGFILSATIRDFKKFTSKGIIRNIKSEPESRREWLLTHFSASCTHLKRDQDYKVWQDGYHAEELLSNKFIYQKLNYIHDNPVKEQIVRRAEDYLYSSAGDYAGYEGLLKVCLI